MLDETCAALQRRLILATPLTLLAAADASAQSFGPGERLGSQDPLVDVQRFRAVDVDMNGHLDITWMVGERGVVTVAFNDGEGRFGRAFDVASTVPHPVPFSANLARTTWVDVDGDGDRDLILPGDGRQTDVIRNDGGGRFIPAGPLDADVPVTPARALDVDADGREDLLVMSDPAGLLWCANLGGGDFSAPRLLDVGDPIHVLDRLFGPREAITVEKADIDRDGVADLFWTSPDVAWARGLGGASYAAPTTLWPGNLNEAHRLIDFGGDGDLDLVFVPQAGATELLFLENDGAGAFSAPRSSSPLPFSLTQRMFVEDLDGDGDADAIATGFTSSGRVLTAFLQDAQGGFASTPLRGVRLIGSSGRDTLVAAFRPSGLADVVVGHRWIERLSLVQSPDAELGPAQRLLDHDLDYNRGRASAGDVDRDGVIETFVGSRRIHVFEDIGVPGTHRSVIRAGTNSIPSAAPLAIDFDGDGDEDLLYALNEWSSLRTRLYLAESATPRPDAVLLAEWPFLEGPTRLLPGDANGDGALDLLIDRASQSQPRRVNWLVQNAGGGLDHGGPIQLTTFDWQQWVALDVDGDGADDLVAFDFENREVIWYRTTGVQQLDGPRTLIPSSAQGYPSRSVLASADLDLDGDRDLIVALPGDGVVHFENLGGGAVRRSQRIHGGASLEVVAGDLDLDGDEDVVVRDVDVIIVFTNDGTGRVTETSRTPAPTTGSTHVLQLEDVDGDGDLDLQRLDLDVTLHRNELRLGRGFCLGAGDAPSPRPRLVVRGSEAVADDDLELGAEGLAPGSAGLFVVGSERALTPAGSGLAPLCLAGAVQRLDGPGQVQAAGPDGRVALPVNLTTLGVGVGVTLHIQRWTRDGTGGSGFTSGISVTFR